MRDEAQISAWISNSTREQLERYAEELQHHFQALREIPTDIVVPARILVSAGSGRAVIGRIAHPRKPTPAMKRLFRMPGE